MLIRLRGEEVHVNDTESVPDRRVSWRLASPTCSAPESSELPRLIIFLKIAHAPVCAAPSERCTQLRHAGLFSAGFESIYTDFEKSSQLVDFFFHRNMASRWRNRFNATVFTFAGNILFYELWNAGGSSFTCPIARRCSTESVKNNL